MAHFVPARASDTAEMTDVRLINNVIRLHCCPDRIIADNDSRLRAGFLAGPDEKTGGRNASHQRLPSPLQRKGRELALDTVRHPEDNGDTVGE